MTHTTKRKQSCHSFSISTLWGFLVIRPPRRKEALSFAQSYSDNWDSSWLLCINKELFKQREEMEEEKETIRSCIDCKTTKTPMWRGGPSGPKSLCNACGIRFRKQRRSELLGMRIIHNHKAYKKVNPPPSSPYQSPSPLSLSHGSVALKKRRSLKEEEQAALCLLLLSCNSVFA